MRRLLITVCACAVAARHIAGFIICEIVQSVRPGLNVCIARFALIAWCGVSARLSGCQTPGAEHVGDPCCFCCGGPGLRRHRHLEHGRAGALLFRASRRATGPACVILMLSRSRSRLRYFPLFGCLPASYHVWPDAVVSSVRRACLPRSGLFTDSPGYIALARTW